MSHFFEQAPSYLPILMQGVYLTVLVTIGAFVLATVLGLVWASMRVSGIAPLAFTASTIIIIVRGIPGMVILFYIYFVMPDLGLSLTAVQSAIIGLGIAYSPYMAEVFHSGIEAIDRGQTEAALSIGMGWGLLMRRIILPQAIRVALPPYGSTMIMLLKDSSLASTITVAELSLQGKLLASSTFENTIIFTLVAFIYLAMSLPLTAFNSWLERRLGKSR
ncbi:amino acid ABC transporter permease [Aliirhizobium cellulosilyticum]|uniref:Polar amino acid transport system permease protein n=1 Tax=Aliirhizobium cellulosilyticum TaxID=393664 RepID=A0A7W6WRT6_9HYPH|nr:amino acid ABC transporter permease [Rhizobium cellulosilyticum]MBB4350762.1 polar amino acid transport system permease protein [Rhizobium cellulosilyticum]MBB4413956.1 polar amino acid transport system permease protein [Rhizobium cellulosilyticum]MBB4448571.1 polar amino acid transport system permease protein [Rhizobium cellulosilyticum]